ncbi:MAG TPA: DegT/DnrJ/EryC1/StrS family aminotransferase [Cyclobacteriaceae bacterium]|nr:DegT/DnrJ/EryC1/StrS family aminotransferase [Cyclobacteriaceae bacterium]
MRIPFLNLLAQYESIKSDIDAAISKVLTTTTFVGGTFVSDFEKGFAALYGVKHVISCGNGTDSLFIIMKMLGIGRGDEVITVANSWISSSETITQTGAKPVFVDIDPEYYSINESMLMARITRNTKAIIAVHLQGQMCEMNAIRKVCEERGIYLIEDCAQSHFSAYKGQRAGLFGIAGSFSFYPGKNLGAYGDAGCIITNHDELAMKFRMYAHHGALTKHDHKIEGINSRLDSIQAAILTVKLKHILAWTERRIENAALYAKYLEGINKVVIPKVRPGTKHTFHLYVIQAERRDQLQSYLSSRGIETSIHYPTALPNLEAYRYLGHTPDDFPVATRLQSRILSLPMYPELTEEMIQQVCDNIRKFYADLS